MTIQKTGANLQSAGCAIAGIGCLLVVAVLVAIVVVVVLRGL